jgi:hypothetical protein
MRTQNPAPGGNGPGREFEREKPAGNADASSIAELAELRARCPSGAAAAVCAVGFRLIDGVRCAVCECGALAAPERIGAVFQSPGDRLLGDVRKFVSRFCVLPDEHCLTAVTLWAAHCHMVKEFHTTPRLIVSSPEAGSGKTRVLEVLDLLVPESLLTLNASPAAIFRTLSSRQVTLLFDEVDAIWNKRGQDDNHEDLRALLNAGYKRGATIPRCTGPKHEVTGFPVFCAAALAGLGDLPDTIMTRAVILRMRRRAPTEHVEPFRTRTHEPEGRAIRDRLSKWAAVVGAEAGRAWPKLPDGIVDRPAEVWEPLIAVADAAGGKWPQIARDACVALCKVGAERRASLGVRLLSDLRVIFGESIALHTETVIERLVSGEGLEDDAPWADLHGRPIGKRTLASLLAKYNVRPLKVTVNGRSLQGYRREHLWDAWVRYLPSPDPARPELPELSASRGATTIPPIPAIPEVRHGEGASEPGSVREDF